MIRFIILYAKFRFICSRPSSKTQTLHHTDIHSSAASPCSSCGSHAKGSKFCSRSSWSNYIFKSSASRLPPGPCSVLSKLPHTTMAKAAFFSIPPRGPLPASSASFSLLLMTTKCQGCLLTAVGAVKLRLFLNYLIG